MAINYPTSLDTLTNPEGTQTLNSPDHAQQHSDANDILEAVEAVLGTTAGTSVLKDFSAGQFPARVNSGGTIVQTLTGGTINSSIFGTPSITGGTTTGQTISSPSFGGSVSGWNAVSETWTYDSADAPVYTWKADGTLNTIYSKGMKVRFDQAGTTRYAVLVNDPTVSSGTTTFTGYIGTASALGTGAITNAYYSVNRSPYGFPMSAGYWSVETTDVTGRTQSSPTANTWYNLGTNSITVPIGDWNLYYKVAPYTIKSSTSQVNAQVTLGTTNNSETDKDFTGWVEMVAGSTASNMYSLISVSANKNLSLTTKTVYYVNSRTLVASASTLGNANDVAKLVVRASSTLI